MRFQTNRSGFTLAELLVSVSIIVLFSAVLLPSLGRFGRRNELTQAAQLVQSKINEAKAFSLGPRSEGGVISQSPLVRSPIVQYQVYAPLRRVVLRDPEPCPRDQRHLAIIEITNEDLVHLSFGRIYGEVASCDQLPSGIEFTSPSGQPAVSFSVLGQGAVLEPSPPATMTFTIRHTRLTQANCRDIVLRKATGQVTISTPPYTC